MPEKILHNATIIFLIREVDGRKEVLLARKMKKIGQGKWNGYGGGINPNETPSAGAARELKEEAYIEIPENEFQSAGTIDFHNTTEEGIEFTAHCHLFTVDCTDLALVPGQTDEMMEPTWFPISELPEELLPADKFWIPEVLKGKIINAEAHYGPHQKELRGTVTFREVPDLLFRAESEFN